MLLHQNQENIVYLTLSDSIPSYVTAATPYFLFKFVSLTTNDEILFTAPDITSAITRYNEFSITLTGSNSTNLTAGTISMNPSGEWLYYVYPQDSNTNISLTGVASSWIEKGIITLSGTPNTIIQQSYTGESTTYKYYNG